ncbi:MAG TPA: metal ABC transporter substrate-binding protein [Sedimentisphaerales bacterium]|nr:metal ABC transporter substrate-binding protein [Sedimentisphaerales bacterium]
MKKILVIIALVSVFPITGVHAKPHLNVVTTLPDYAYFAKLISGDRVSVKSIVRGDQDAHFIRPKPSFATALRNADVLVATGLDLELWVQTVIDNSGNRKIRSGQAGYVSASAEMKLLEKPQTLSRAEGGVHIYGNPHVTCSPILMKIAARNIATGLIKNDPEGKEIYLQNLKKIHQRLDERLFGPKLVEILGGDILCNLAEQDMLIPFLQEQKFEGRPLIEYLDGWMKMMLPLRGTPIVTYHKNWIYFVRLFGLEEAGTVEPKPGIPPSPKHVANLINLMRERNIVIILAANYFDEQKIRTVAARTNAEAVIVPLYVGGAAGVDDYFELVDHWINGVLRAAEKKGLTSKH